MVRDILPAGLITVLLMFNFMFNVGLVKGRRTGYLPEFLCLFLTGISVVVLGLSTLLQAQSDQPVQTQTGSIVGTATDVNGDTLAGADVVLETADAKNRRTAVTNDDGFFEFHDVQPGVPHRLTVSGQGFAAWTSPLITIEPNQYRIVNDIKLGVAAVRTTVDVTQTAEEVATEQVKTEETQRVLGIFPNFYVVYEPNPVPLTTKLKFRLAFRVATDPITFLGIGLLSGAQQAGDTPDYGQGAQGFGKRFGANTLDNVTDIMIGGAILPSLLHQDPRYFYQGTGTVKSRMRHAVLNPFICKGDNGKWQPNYSSLGGDLASSAISNAYYPQSNRGAGLTFSNFAISTAERVASSLAQEFVLNKFTHKGHSK